MPTDPDHVLLADEIVALREQIAKQAAAHAAIVDRLETVIGKLVEDNRALKEKVRQLSGGSRIRLTSDASQLSIFHAPVVLDDQ